MHDLKEKDPLLEITTLGGLSIQLGEQPVTGFISRKVDALLVYLTCTGDPQPREVLGDLLWDELSQSHTLSNLRSALSSLRKQLSDYFIITRNSIGISPHSNHRVDCLEFEALLTAARQNEAESGGPSPSSVEGLIAAVDLYRGDFLQGFFVRDSREFEQWVTIERERFHRLFLEALSKLTAWYLQKGDYFEGMDYASQWLNHDPLSENANRHMMLLLAYNGQEADALRQYQEYARLLEAELGLPPSPETTALLETIKNRDIHSPTWQFPGLATVPQAKSRPIPHCPYQGLYSFREEDARFFFGRETIIERLVHAAQRNPILALIGPSGSGKSSVVLAGLLPRLKTTGRWQYAVFRPGKDPFRSMATALNALLKPESSDPSSQVEIHDLAQSLKENSQSLQDVLARVNPPQARPRRVLLIADQFEELYTHCSDQELQVRFLDLIMETFSPFEYSAESAATFLVTLRADFLGKVLAHRPFADAIQDADVKLGPMTREELTRVVQKPAKLQGIAFESGLVERILDDVGAEPGNLPLLEFALTALWDLQENGQLTHAAYESIGRVEGSLARYAEEVYSSLSPENQQSVRRVFTQMILPGEQTEDVRRQAVRSELGEADWALAQHLADARLLVTDQDTFGVETVELVHEALIQGWDRLRNWMEVDRAFRAWQERMRGGLRQWETSDHDPGALLRGVPLAEAESRLNEDGDRLIPGERAFIWASLEARDARRTAEERRRQRELHAAKKLAETEQRRATEQTRSAQQLRRRALYLAGALMAVLAVSIVAILLGVRATQSSREADRQSRIALSRELALRSSELLHTDPELGLHLAIHAVNTNYKADEFVTSEAEIALYRALDQSPFRGVLGEYFGLINSAVYSPNGNYILTASDDGIARLWDAEGKLIRQFAGHSDAVNSAEFSPDSSRIVTTGDDGIARIWDLEGDVLAIYPGHTGAVNSAQFSPDGNYLLTSGDDGTARMWNASEGTVLILRGHSGAVNYAQYSPDGTRILTASDDETARLWDLNGETIVSFEGHTGSVKSVAFSPGGTRIITASVDRTARIWDLNGNLLNSMQGHQRSVVSAVYTPDGSRIITASLDGTIQSWDGDGSFRAKLIENPVPFYASSISPDGRHLLTVSPGSAPSKWAIAGPLVAILKGHTRRLWSAQFSPDGTRILTSSDDNTARLWDASGSLLSVLEGHSGPVRRAVFSPDGSRIVTSSTEPMVRVWDDTGEFLMALQADQFSAYLEAARPAGFSPDGKIIFTGGSDATARLWDSTGNQIRSLNVPEGFVFSVTFSPDGNRILVATYGNVGSTLWNGNGERVNLLQGHSIQPVLSASFSPDGNHLITASLDNTPQLWDSDGNLLTTLSGHSGAVNDAVFSPDGSLILTASDDRTARLWNADGDLLVNLEGHQGAVSAAGFNADSSRIFTASMDGTARIWDAQGNLLNELTGHTAGLNSAAFSPDGGLLITASEDHTARIWKVWNNTDAMLAEAAKRLSRSLTQTECQLYLHLENCP